MKSVNNLDDKFNHSLDKIYSSFSNVAFTSVQIIKIIDNFFKTDSTFKIGDQLYIYYPLFSHHGIYVGNYKVIHYTTANISLENVASGSRIGIKKPIISITTLDKFNKGKNFFKKRDILFPPKYSPNEIVERAYSRLGENKYHPFLNNCEDFIHWCKYGD
jgi:HRAS-like suppressor 3